MNSLKFNILCALCMMVFGCGSQGTSPDNENAYVVSEYNMDLFTLFFCSTNISPKKNADLYEVLGYGEDNPNVSIAAVYSVFYGEKPKATERVLRAEVSQTESGVTVFNQSGSKYLDDTDQSALIELKADVSDGDNKDGSWQFSIVNNAAVFTYTDTDLAQAISYSFSTEEGNAECAGSVANDPTAG